MYIYGQNISCWPSKEELLNWQKRCSYFVSFYKEDGLVIKDMLLRNYDTFYCRIQKADMLTYQLHKLEQEVSRLLWDHISWNRNSAGCDFQDVCSNQNEFPFILLFRILTQMHGYSSDKLLFYQSIYLYKKTDR